MTNLWTFIEIYTQESKIRMPIRSIEFDHLSKTTIIVLDEIKDNKESIVVRTHRGS
jgi:hypothetical protein